MELPYWTADLAGTGGVMRATADDFRVDEVPAYAPSGAGDHILARIEKRGLTTAQAVERIARALGVAPRDVGIAGMKDRHAVTRQWISLPPPTTPERIAAIAVDDLVVLEAARHAHKLRTGHLRGNRFILAVRDVGHPQAAQARAEAILARLSTPPGAPNWFGEQRFGNAGNNAARGRAILLGDERPPRDRRLARLLLSAWQSELFNSWLVARMASGDYARVIDGDVLHKRGGGMFVCDDPATDQARLARGELVATGPMFGDRMRAPRDGREAAERERHLLEAAGLPTGAFERVRSLAAGTRRDAAIEVGEPRVSILADDAFDLPGSAGPRATADTRWGGAGGAIDRSGSAGPRSTADRRCGGAIEVAFTLPAGAYATAVMREIMKPSEPRESVPTRPTET
jgi:tRNA pseudouridine13 synthase